MFDQPKAEEKVKTLTDILSEEGRNFIQDYPIGAEVQHVNDPNTYGTTQPGGVYDNQMRNMVNIKLEKWQNQEAHCTCPWMLSSVAHKPKPQV